MSKIILVAGAWHGLGKFTAEALALAGYTVYAPRPQATGSRNAVSATGFSPPRRHRLADLRLLDLDVHSQASVEAAVAQVMAESGRIDVVIHGAGYRAFGPGKILTPEGFGQLDDMNSLSAGRVNRAVLPHLRRQRQGLVVSVSGGNSGANAAQQARQFSRWGIATCIVVPPVATNGAVHALHARNPADGGLATHRDAGPYAWFGEPVRRGSSAGYVPSNADAIAVADAIVDVVDAPFGEVPFRINVGETEISPNIGAMAFDGFDNAILHRAVLSEQSTLRVPA
ncbi:MAG: SDR family NAD(P)-dependent oxidoreductase [Acetobacteraceae bacterium]